MFALENNVHAWVVVTTASLLFTILCLHSGRRALRARYRHRANELEQNPNERVMLNMSTVHSCPLRWLRLQVCTCIHTHTLTSCEHIVCDVRADWTQILHVISNGTMCEKSSKDSPICHSYVCVCACLCIAGMFFHSFSTRSVRAVREWLLFSIAFCLAYFDFCHWFTWKIHVSAVLLYGITFVPLRAHTHTKAHWINVWLQLQPSP